MAKCDVSPQIAVLMLDFAFSKLFSEKSLRETALFLIDHGLQCDNRFQLVLC